MSTTAGEKRARANHESNGGSASTRADHSSDSMAHH